MMKVSSESLNVPVLRMAEKLKRLPVYSRLELKEAYGT